MERIIQKINLILGITAHLQNRGFSARLRDSGFVLHLGSQMHFCQNSPASQMRKTLGNIKKRETLTQSKFRNK